MIRPLRNALVKALEWALIITMAVLVVGVQGMLDISPEGKVVQSLKQSAEKLSLRLGAHGEPKQP